MRNALTLSGDTRFIGVAGAAGAVAPVVAADFAVALRFAHTLAVAAHFPGHTFAATPGVQLGTTSVTAGLSVTLWNTQTLALLAGERCGARTTDSRIIRASPIAA